MTKPSLVRLFEGRKFVWDGEEHDGEEAAASVERSYRDQGFEVRRLVEGSTCLLYTRRPVLSTNGSTAEEEVQND